MENNLNKYLEIINSQREYFNQNATKDLNFRLMMLKRLKSVIKKYEHQVLTALMLDLGKSEYEAYESEVGFIYEEINFTLKHLARWVKPTRVKTSIANFPSRSKIYYEPFGVCLIMSPWNYPFQLTMAPLIAAIASGNCCIVKPSDYSKNVSDVISKITAECFENNFVYTIRGGRAETSFLLNEKFDYIFFTGSVTVGKVVMEAASKHLTPVTLELGGKSPCIIDKTANIDLAAKRLCWGKFLNSGQTCVAPDYVFVEHSVQEEFLKCIRKYISEFYGNNPLDSAIYPKIINDKHFARLSSLVDEKYLYCGGRIDAEKLKIEPTILKNPPLDSLIMTDEIFGPILPVISYRNLNEIITFIKSRPKPLATYIFSNNKPMIDQCISSISFGGGCVNDCVMHLVSPYMPFGGVGESGMGGYHGIYGFKTFSHAKSVLNKSTLIDVPLRYPPFTDKKLNMIKKIMG